MGLGLATLFRRACNERDCIRFNGPVLSEVDGRVFQYGDECYKYKRVPAAKCDTAKKIVEISDGTDPETGAPDKGQYYNPIPVSDAAAAAATDVSGGATILDRAISNIMNVAANIRGAAAQ